MIEFLHDSLAEIDFGNDFLNNYCFSIKNNIAYIHYNHDGKKTSADYIHELINKKIPIVTISFHDKNGTILQKIFIANFIFKKINNIFDYDWKNHDKLKHLEVEFEYDKYFLSNEKYKKYLRKQKLNKINHI